MKLKQREFTDISDVDVSFFTSRLACHALEDHDNLLVIGFKSHREVTSKDLCYMDAMKLAASTVWSPAAIILDFRELHYRWGDTMDCLFRSPYPHTELEKALQLKERRCVIVAVKSPLSEEGLTSLVKSEMGKDPSTLLFDSLEDAIKAVESQLLASDS